VKIGENNMVLPTIFAIPKLHKNPYKFRFIAGARFSSIKSVSLLLTTILSFVKQHFENYCMKVEKFSGSKFYWSVCSSLQALKRLRCVKNCRTLTTADFSTLYTSLPHNLVKEQLWFLIDLVFCNAQRTSGGEFLCVGYKSCFYSTEPKDNYKCFRKEEIMDLVNFVLENTYVSFCGFIFQQISGIPMGGNASPLLADLTLTALEYKFLKSLSAHEQRNMGISFRYIDDVLNINGNDFLNCSKNIYPASLPLENTTRDAASVDFLDITISMAHGSLTTTLFNKVDSFNFNVIRLPDSSSNVHSNLGYNTYYSQLIRFARICCMQCEFESKVKMLWDMFEKKGFDKCKLFHISSKFVHNYKLLVFELGYSNSELVKYFRRLYSC